jgi:16S rRNA (guanine527-N7)-methyltransferase
MPTLPTDRLATLLAPYLGAYQPPSNLFPQLSTYLDLLLKWNARTNLTAIRDPEEMVRRHFGESLFTGVHLAARLDPSATLLDLGSGAGFPGLPIQLLLPGLQVTLAESQNKKATFLREAVRTLGLGTRLHAARAETLTTRFDASTLRAVDNRPAALAAAQWLLARGGWLAMLTSSEVSSRPEAAALADGVERPAAPALSYRLPNSDRALLTLQQRG